jgi:hypothetical protein
LFAQFVSPGHARRGRNSFTRSLNDHSRMAAIRSIGDWRDRFSRVRTSRRGARKTVPPVCTPARSRIRAIPNLLIGFWKVSSGASETQTAQPLVATAAESKALARQRRDGRGLRAEADRPERSR